MAAARLASIALSRSISTWRRSKLFHVPRSARLRFGEQLLGVFEILLRLPKTIAVVNRQVPGEQSAVQALLVAHFGVWRTREPLLDVIEALHQRTFFFVRERLRVAVALDAL